MQGNWDFGLGDRDATATLFNIQPVIPFAVSESTNVILRVIMPLTSQPGPDGHPLATAWATSSPPPSSPQQARPHDLGHGAGLPLAAATNDSIGTEKFGVGPTVVALTQPGKWTIGVLFNQIWSMSGANDAPT